MIGTALKGIFLALLLAGCGEPRQEPVRLFARGDMVEFVVSGQRAQIIQVNICTMHSQRTYGCTYEVRVFSPQTYTDTHLLSSDGPLSTAHIARIDYVREFELRKAR